jgi:hypothetical protein
MKGMLMLAVLMAGMAETGAQLSSTNHLSVQAAGELSRHLNTTKSTQSWQLKTGRRAYGGFAVQFAHSDHPLQLLSPAAPAYYGSASPEVLRDPVRDSVPGWKFLEIKF